MQKPNQPRGTKEDTAKVVLVIISIKGTKAATQQQREGQKEWARPFFQLKASKNEVLKRHMKEMIEGEHQEQ